MTKEIVMKIRRFWGVIFFASMLLWGAECYGQTLTRITEGNYRELGLEDNRLVGCWLLDSSMINDDMVASESLSQYDTGKTSLPNGELWTYNYNSWNNPFYKHFSSELLNEHMNKVYPKLVIASEDGRAPGVETDWYESVTSVIEDYENYRGYSKWRLPTQRELMLIYIATQLTEGETPTFQEDFYWSASACIPPSFSNMYYREAACVSFPSGTTYNCPKTADQYDPGHYFRPVLEL